MTPKMLNVGSLIKVSLNGQTHSCKIVQVRHGKIEVEYVNCPNKPAFWLDESDPNIVKNKVQFAKRVPGIILEHTRK